MKSDIEIAQEAVLWPIQKVAEHLDIPEDDLELYGKYKAKLSDEYLKSIEDRKDGKLILVTAINPTPAGEGKTTTSVGLGEAFAKMGKKAVIALREPSLGPCFDMFYAFVCRYQRISSTSCSNSVSVISTLRGLVPSSSPTTPTSAS